MGVIGTLIAIFPDLWVDIFTDDPGVRAASRHYLSVAAPMYAFLGLSISMYFSAQGAAKVIGPVLAQTARLLFISVGGWWLTRTPANKPSISSLVISTSPRIGDRDRAASRATPDGA